MSLTSYHPLKIVDVEFDKLCGFIRNKKKIELNNLQKPIKIIPMTQNKTIVLYTFNDFQEATLIQNKLKENGINSFLENQNPIGLNPLGGIELKIFSKDKEAAEKIINE
jgi:hypothetical protein